MALELPLIEFSQSFVGKIFSVTIFGLTGNKDCLFHQDSVPGLYFFFFFFFVENDKLCAEASVLTQCCEKSIPCSIRLT